MPIAQDVSDTCKLSLQDLIAKPPYPHDKQPPLPTSLLAPVAIMFSTQQEYGATENLNEESTSPYHLQEGQHEEDEQQPQSNASEGLDEEYEMSLTELLYSSSSYHAIVKPGK